MSGPTPKNEMRAFITILAGQMVSIIGTGLTNFAIGVWVYRQTGSVTKFSMTMLAITLPSILIAPIAGALVDRWNHRWTMILGDSVAAVCSAALAAMLYFNDLHLWAAVLIIAIAAMVSVLHSLAYTATIPLLIPKEHLVRAVGALQIGPAVAQVLSPALAGLMLSVMAVHSVILFDVASFLVALVSLLLVRTPDQEVSAEGQAVKGSLLREAAQGWLFIRNRPGLLWLAFFFAVVTFVMTMSNVVLTPMLLSMTSVGVVGTVASAASFGMLAGSILLSIWGGPKKRMYGVLGFGVLLGMCMMLMGVRPSPWLIAIAGFGFVFSVPIVEGCSQAIWLSKTPADLQGRVLSMKMLIGWSVAPIAYLAAGPLIDRLFEPAMSANGLLASSLGHLIGTGHGRGMGLMIIVLGLFMMLVTLASSTSRRVRLLEQELSDAVPDQKVQELAEKPKGALA